MQKHTSPLSDELFNQIYLVNKLVLIDTLSDLDTINENTINQLKSACLDQIEVLSWHIGAKSVSPQTAI